MKDRIQNHAVIASVLLFFVVTILAGVWLVHFNQRELETSLRASLELKEKRLQELADITDRNGADEIVTKIIADCSRRPEFESLLVRLSELNGKELLTLQNLEDACGGFYAERKALMVSKLEQEFQNYSETVKFLLLLTSHDSVSYHVADWNALVTLEQERSDLLTEQRVLQKEIITALMQGSSVQSTRVQDLVHEAQEIAELLTVHDRQIDEKRDALMVP